MKDFDTWNIEKKRIENCSENRAHFHVREIWWASLGINVGDEQDGKNSRFERPVLIIKKFNNKIAWIIPLTTKSKKGIYYFPIANRGITQDSYLVLSQLKLLSAKRFLRRMGRISRQTMNKIQQQILEILKN